MASGLGELFIELGTVGNVQELEKFVKKVREATEAIEKNAKAQNKQENNIQKTIKSFGTIVGAITAATYALNRLTTDLVKNNQAFLNLTRNSNIALSSFQKWDGIGKMFGIENAANQLDSLNQRLFELRLTGEGARGFQLAGINPIGQDAEGILEQLRSRIQGMDNTTASYLLQQMGLDPKMITILRMGRKEFEELGRIVNKYSLSEDQRAQIEQLNVQLQIANTQLQYMKNRVLIALMPYFVKFMRSIANVTEFLVNMGANIGKILVKFRALFVPLAIGLVKFTKFGNIIKSISAGLGGIITKIPIIGRLIAGLGGILGKTFWWLTGIYLLLDDFAVFMNGGKSVIGEFVNWGKNQGKDFSDIGETAQTDSAQATRDALIKLTTVLNDFIHESAEWLSRLSGLPLNRWVEKYANFMSRGAIDKAQNYDYSHGRRQTLSYVTPSMNQNVDNSTNSSDSSTTINMQNYIETQQPAFDITRELRYAMAMER